MKVTFCHPVSPLCVFVDRVEKKPAGRPICRNILAVHVESLQYLRDDLLCPGRIVRFQLSEKLVVFHPDPVRFESVAGEGAFVERIEDM